MRRLITRLRAALRRPTRRQEGVSPALAARQKADLCHPAMRGTPRGWGRISAEEEAVFRSIRDHEMARAGGGGRAAGDNQGET